ncbi:MAG: hypothetical protein AB1657_03165 [Candidatus Micrarchaeota archaeon]
MLRSFNHSLEFFRERHKFVILFSIPFFFALLIPMLVSAPTYIALGGVFLRTGSIPELDAAQVAVTILAYLVSLYIISDSIVNVNLLIKSKKTLTKMGTEVAKAMGTYAVNIFLIYTLAALIMLVLQLLTFDFAYRGVVLPIVSMLLGLVLFFVPPAIVIDGMKMRHAVAASAVMAVRKLPHVLFWALFGAAALTVAEFVFLFLPYPFGVYLTMLFNSVVVIPFLLIYQTFIYMKKYPLAH